MTHTTRRSAWSGFAAIAAIALTLSAGSAGVWAQEKTKPLPPGVTSCDFGAFTNDRTLGGAAIHAEPSADSAILGRLPVLEILGEKIAADFHVVGVKNGWFLIEHADYSNVDTQEGRPPVYAGRGWISGTGLTTQVRRYTLKAMPDEKAADSGEMFDDFGVTAILDCTGEWVRVEAPLAPPDDTPKPKPPAGSPKGVVRGWTHGVCANQRSTCGG